MSTRARCLTCNSTETTHFLHVRDHGSGEIFALRRCGRCGLVFTWPYPADLNKYYPPYYRQYPRWVLRGFQFMQQVRTGGWVKTIGPAGRAVELGCGEGWILAALRRRGWWVAGIERTPQSAQFASHQLGLPVIVGGFEALRSTPGFDLIILHQVLEHLPHPMHTLRECARLLRPCGQVIIEVPNLDSWQFLYARRHWVHLDVPRHVSHFTPESLRRALEQAGLQVERYGFVSFEYDPFGWLQAILNQLGFPQNLLLRWLAGNDRRLLVTPTGILMALLSLALALPSVAVAVVSWTAHRGAMMEVRARKPT